MQRDQRILDVAFIEGRNFNGEIKISQNVLRFDLTQFKKGQFHSVQITNSEIQREYKRYLIFKNIQMLSDELAINKHMEISDSNVLIIPFQVVYRNRTFVLSIEIPLNLKIFTNQSVKFQTLFQQIQRLNNQKIKIQKYLPELIYFQGDPTNKNYKYFQLSHNQKRIKRVGRPQAMIFNHFQVLPRKGIFYFTAKIIKGDQITLGVCSEHIKQLVGIDIFESHYYIGLDLSNGQLIYNNTYSVVAPQLDIEEGESTFKVEINVNKKEISWYKNEDSICCIKMPRQVYSTDIYPIFTLCQNQDVIQIVIK